MHTYWERTTPSNAGARGLRGRIQLALSMAALLVLMQLTAARGADPSDGQSTTSADRFVIATSPTDMVLRAASTSELPELFIRCYPITDTLNYCLHLGWTVGDGTAQAAVISGPATLSHDQSLSLREQQR